MQSYSSFVLVALLYLYGNILLIQALPSVEDSDIIDSGKSKARMEENDSSDMNGREQKSEDVSSNSSDEDESSPPSTRVIIGSGNVNSSERVPDQENDDINKTTIEGVYSKGNSCVFQNGIIFENGVARQATAKEEARLHDYVVQMERYNQQQLSAMHKRMRSEMARVFAPGFPFNQQMAAPVIKPIQSKIPQMPKPPCLCKGNCDNLLILEHDHTLEQN